MITEMRVQRFRALKDVTVRLGKFNVLIGPNDSGKTSFLEAVYALSRSAKTYIQECFWHAPDATLVYNHDGTTIRFAALLSEHVASEKPLHYTIEVRLGDEGCRVVRELVGNTVLRGKPSKRTLVSEHGTEPYQVKEDLDAIRPRLHPAIMTRWDIEELGKTSRLPPQRDQPFDPTGYGLSTCLGELKLLDDEMFNAISSEFCNVFPEFKGISFQRVRSDGWHRDKLNRRVAVGDGDAFQMLLVRSDGVKVPADAASGGTLVVLAFLTMAKLGRGLLLVEEPENGLHPERLQQVIELLRDACIAAPDTQVVITTHSPFVLDCVEPHEVRVFRRNAAGDVEVYHLDDLPDIKDRLRFALLGELIYSDWPGFLKEIGAHAHPGLGRRAE